MTLQSCKLIGGPLDGAIRLVRSDLLNQTRESHAFIEPEVNPFDEEQVRNQDPSEQHVHLYGGVKGEWGVLYFHKTLR